MFPEVRDRLRTSCTKVFMGSRFSDSPEGRRGSAGDDDSWEVGGMDDCGKGEGFVDGEAGGENSLLDGCWLGGLFDFVTIRLIMLAPFVGARKT